MKNLNQRIYGFIADFWGVSGTATTGILAGLYFVLVVGVGEAFHFILGEQSFLDNPDGFRTSFAIQIVLVLAWIAFIVRALTGGMERWSKEHYGEVDLDDLDDDEPLKLTEDKK